MVKALHRAGIEVILDVVYNHTCEGNHLGPTLSPQGARQRGLLRLTPDAPALLPGLHRVRQQPEPRPPPDPEAGDGLAALLGGGDARGRVPLRPGHHAGPDQARLRPRTRPSSRPSTRTRCSRRVKLIAEPWDVGLGGYQVGNFPVASRSGTGSTATPSAGTGRATTTLAAEIGYRLTGSSDLFQLSGREPTRSRQLRHRPRRLHPARPGHLQPEAQRGEPRGQPRRRRRQPLLELRRGGRDRRPARSTRCASGRSATSSPRSSSPRACRCCWPATRSAAPSGATTTPTARTTRSPGWTGTSTSGRKSLLEFTRRLIQLRQRAAGAAAAALLPRRSTSGTRSSRTWPGSGPTASEMTAGGLETALRPLAGLPARGRRHRHPRPEGNKVVGDTLLVLMNAHHEPVEFVLPAIEWGSGLGDPGGHRRRRREDRRLHPRGGQAAPWWTAR